MLWCWVSEVLFVCIFLNPPLWWLNFIVNLTGFLITSYSWVCLWRHFSESITWRKKTPPVNWGLKLNRVEKKNVLSTNVISLFDPVGCDPLPHLLTVLTPCNDGLNLLKSWTKVKTSLKLLFLVYTFFFMTRRRVAHLCFWILAFHSKEIQIGSYHFNIYFYHCLDSLFMAVLTVLLWM